MDKSFIVSRNKEVGIGDVFRHEDQLFVITHILSVLSCDAEGNFEVHVFAQEYDKEYEKEYQYGVYQVYTKEYEEMKESYKNTFEYVGKPYITPEGYCGFVSNIMSITKEEDKLTMTGIHETYHPWSEEEMKRAVKKERLSTFKVIDRKD